MQHNASLEAENAELRAELAQVAAARAAAEAALERASAERAAAADAAAGQRELAAAEAERCKTTGLRLLELADHAALVAAAYEVKVWRTSALVLLCSGFGSSGEQQWRARGHLQCHCLAVSVGLTVSSCPDATSAEIQLNAVAELLPGCRLTGRCLAENVWRGSVIRMRSRRSWKSWRFPGSGWRPRRRRPQPRTTLPPHPNASALPSRPSSSLQGARHILKLAIQGGHLSSAKPLLTAHFLCLGAATILGPSRQIYETLC